MSFIPYIGVWLLLAAVPLTTIFFPRRSSLLSVLSIALNVLALVIWFIARPSATISFTLASWPAEPAPLGWGWQIDAANWQLTGIVLWLAFGLLLYLAAVPSPTTPKQTATVGLLAAVLLPALWASTPATLITTWALFAAVCLVIEEAATSRQLVRGRLPWLLSPILLYACGVALSNASTADSLITSAWSSVAIALTMLAAALQMGVGVLTTVTTVTTAADADNDNPITTLLLRLLPALIGVALLGRLVATITIPYSAGLLLTLLGLIALLGGVWLAWVGPATTNQTNPSSGLFLALAAIALLTAIWAGPVPLLAASRVLIFAPATLFLVGNQRRGRGAAEQRSKGEVGSGQLAVGSLPVSQSPSLNSPLTTLHSSLFRPHIIALAITFLAIAGLPPTAGFASLASLYSVWMSGIHVLLVLAMALLLVALLAIIYRFIQRVARPIGQLNNASQPLSSARRWLMELSPLLLIAAVLPPGGLPWREAPIGTWAALFLTALGGLLLPHFLRQTGSLRAAVREALMIRPLSNQPASQSANQSSGVFGRLTASLTDAFADAYAILESDGGLLWLFALILLFWWIS